ncbi:MAG: ACP S-malonyltransferase [Methylococcus sp.]
MSRVNSRLAFLFPGQGSQTVGMLRELAEQNPIVLSVYAEASEVLGHDLWELVSQGPEERLNATQFTQPAMLAAGVAAWRVWCGQTDVRPGWLAGHSLGEYTALVCAESLDFRDAIRLVAERARLMQEAVPADVGAMAAILGLEDAQVVSVCEQAGSGNQVVTAANFNAPGQVVIAGHREAVERATAVAKEAGAKRAILLPVSVPSHCPLMKDAADQFRQSLEALPLQTPVIPVIHNVDVAAHADAAAIRLALYAQLHGSVRWAETIDYLTRQGVDSFVECGPGRVLAGLNKRNAPGARTECLFDPVSLDKAKGLAA